MSDGMTVMNGGCSEPAEAAGGPGWLTQMWGLFWFPTNRYFINSGKSKVKNSVSAKIDFRLTAAGDGGWNYLKITCN